MATPSSEFRSRLISLYHKSLSVDFLKMALDSEDLKIRQALALMPGSFSESLLKDYESLLDDKSYTTLENTLYRLWIYNPIKRANYLDRTNNIIGFSDKNIRQLWLLLAILTKDYGTADERIEFQKELFGYTASYQPMQVRQLAFSLIGEVFPFSDQNLKDLINAAIHPAWQFRQFARELVDKLLKDKEHEQRLSSILNSLKGEEYQYLSLKLTQE
jgi:aminopeptidase N